VPSGIEQLVTAYRDANLQASDLEGEQFLRIKRVRSLIDRAVIDNDLRPLAVSS
jgi:hypothetical protein